MWNEYPEECRDAALAFFARHWPRGNNRH
jgi:hypothetical protein